MTRHRSFTTAASRRKADPIVWEVDGQSFALRPSVDLAEMANLLEILQAEPGTDEAPLKFAVKKQKLLTSAIRSFVVETDQTIYDRVVLDLDLNVLLEMVKDLIAEYSGTANPTSPSSSSAGSEPTGGTSTGTAPLEASTQSDSLPTEPSTSTSTL